MDQAPATAQSTPTPELQTHDSAKSEKQGEGAGEKRNAGPRLHVNEEELEARIQIEKEERGRGKLMKMEVSQFPSWLQRALSSEDEAQQFFTALSASNPALLAGHPIQDSGTALRDAMENFNNRNAPLEVRLQHLDLSSCLTFQDAPAGSSAAPANEPPEKGGSQ